VSSRDNRNGFVRVVKLFRGRVPMKHVHAIGVRALGARGEPVTAELPRRRTAVWRQSALARPRRPRTVDQRGRPDLPRPLAPVPSEIYGAACFDRSWPTIATAASQSRRRSIPRSDGELADRPLRSRRSVVHRRRGAATSHRIRSSSIFPNLHGDRRSAA
jgi:hypothetical protein